MNYKAFARRRLGHALLAGVLALLFIASLSLLLVRSRAAAQPVGDESPDIEAGKTVNTTLAKPDDVLTYTITIEDIGEMAGTVWLTDVLPAELVYVADSLYTNFYGSSYGVQDSVITWTATMYGNNQTAIIRFSARISTTDPYIQVQNAAHITTGTGYSTTALSEKTEVALETGNLDHSGTSKTVAPSTQPEAGDLLTYTITLHNDEDIWVPGVQVVDQMPPLLDLDAQSITHTTGSYVLQDDTITWTLDVAAGPGTTETLSFQAFVALALSQSTWITNVAEIYVPGDIFTRTRGIYAHLFEEDPDLLLEKTVNATVAKPDDVLTYTIRIQDIITPAGTVWLTDVLPAELFYVAGSLNSTFHGSSYGVQDNVITWTATMQGNDQTANIQFGARISPTISANQVQNTAQVKTETGYATEFSSPETLISLEAGNLNNWDTKKQAAPTIWPKAGDLLTYTITLHNEDEDIGAPGVRVFDHLPALLTLVADSVTQTTGSHVVQGDAITWTLDVGPGATEVLRFQANVSPDLSQFGPIENVATIDVFGDVFERKTTVWAQPRYVVLDVSKTVAPSDQARPGNYLTYTVRIHNVGDAQAETVWMTDTLPAVPLFNADTLTATHGSFGEAGGVITWRVAAWPVGSLLLPEEEAVLSYTMQVPPTLTENVEITNTAYITAAGALQDVQASVWAIYKRYVYLPLIFKRWPPIPYAPVLSLDDPGEGSNDYTVEWTHDHPQITVITYTLQEADNAAFQNAAEYVVDHTSVQNEKVFNGKPDGTYYYRVRGHNEYGYGAWSNVRSVAIRTLPYVPVLSIDGPPEGGNDYTVRWTYDHPQVPVITYTLEEADNANFTGATAYIVNHVGVENQKAFTDKPDGTYYYRVRGHNSFGDGDWSQAKSTTISTIYYDDFSNAGSEWPIRTRPMNDDHGNPQGYWHQDYRNGEYRIYIENGNVPWDWFYQPNALAPYRPPTNKYCVETSVKFNHGNWWANMGLVFGANEANTDLHVLCLYEDADPNQLGWFLIRNDHYEFPKYGCANYNYKIEGDDRSGTSRSGWNKLQVSVNGNNVKVYIGGNYKGSWDMSGLSSKTRVGVIGGDYELTPVDIRFNYFRVLPNQACTP